MTWDPWAIKPDSEREVWDFSPLAAVGPLIFWMEHHEVEQAVGHRASLGRWGDRLSSASFSPGYTAYYEDGHLPAVAIDACVGPQVRFEGAQLVGRPPSEVADWYGDNFERLQADYVINQHGDPSSDRLGFVIRTQRAGDRLLTRPVFVGWQWSSRCGDIQESYIPEEEWQER